jgi:ABC-type hemin transport system substrate-binding protein
MFNTRAIWIVPLIILLTMLGCNRADAPQQNEGSASTLATLRLAVLSPGMAVMIRDLGYEDLIVAKHDYDLVLTDRVPSAGSELGFDLETLIQSNPTHVFFQTTSTTRSAEFLQAAKDRGWVLFERPLNTLDDIASTMDDLHFLFNGLPQREMREYDMNEVFANALPSVVLAESWSDLGPIADEVGRVLVLGSLDPIGAMGPGSYHYEIIQRLGASPAIATGSMWIEMDYEDLITLNPDAIILIAPRQPREADRFAAPVELTQEQIEERFGPLMDLPISAMHNKRLAIIEHPLGLLPSGALGEVADQIREQFESWNE